MSWTEIIDLVMTTSKCLPWVVQQWPLGGKMLDGMDCEFRACD
jgi:hypothetical protein